MFAIVVASAVWCFAGAAQAGITYTDVVNTAGGYSNIVGGSINNAGQLGFEASKGVTQGIYTSNGTSTTTIAQSGSTFSILSAPTSINDSGTVAFVGSTSQGGVSLYTGNGGALTTIASEGSTFAALYGGSINNAGTVAFVAPSFDLSSSGVYSGNGGALATIAQTGSTYRGFGSYPAINQSGTVFFQGGITNSGAGVFASNGQSTTQYFESSIIQTSNGAINNAGTAVFELQNQSGYSAIVTGNGGPLTTVASTVGSAFLGFQDNTVDINSQGQVAFLAYLAGSATEIELGTPNQLQTVIATGDSLFGSTVTYLAFNDFGLNDQGQVSFYYILSNGVNGLAIANTSVVPEPGSFVLALMGLAGVLAISRFSFNKRSAVKPSAGSIVLHS